MMIYHRAVCGRFTLQTQSVTLIGKLNPGFRTIKLGSDRVIDIQRVIEFILRLSEGFCRIYTRIMGKMGYGYIRRNVVSCRTPHSVLHEYRYDTTLG